MNGWRNALATPRLAPLAGILVGALGGLTYWIAAQLWPTSIAVILCMAATHLATRAHNESCLAQVIAAADRTAPEAHRLTAGMLSVLFLILIEYTTLMALSAANLPVPLPPNVVLGLILIAGNAASRALRVTAIARPAEGLEWADAVTGLDVAIALVLGFAPAALLGIPGLVGLAAAILVRMGLGAWLRHGTAGSTAYLGATQALTAVGFYLGARAAWTYI
jgi:adenosylcobinamide-GDP ribazoletransferase